MSSQQTAIAKIFGEAGFQPIDPPVIQKADPFLDLSGEDIRRRIYVFNDPYGNEVCLRPDLTIPACLHYLSKGASGDERRYAYEGLAFRCEDPSTDKPREFSQSGIERIGGKTDLKADLEVFTFTRDALSAAGLEDLDITIGDLALFDTFIKALNIPKHWRAKLRRSFWQPEHFSSLLKSLGEKKEPTQRIVAVLTNQEDSDALETVSGFMDLAGLDEIPGRSLENVTRRLQEKANDAKTKPLSQEIIGAIEAYLAIKAPAETALDEVGDLAKGLSVDISETLTLSARRAEALGGGAIFATEFGRRFEYYTGFVFELTKGGEAIAGGGRYDNLLARLGAPKNIPAVGAMIRNDRLAAVLKGEAS